MVNRSADWFLQAERDLMHAEQSRAAGTHEWACFAAHQAAEKAVKALYLQHATEAWGHAVARLLSGLSDAFQAPAELVDRGRALDLYYIPTRYPDVLPEGAPFQAFGPLQSEEAIRHARAIIEFVRAALARA